MKIFLILCAILGFTTASMGDMFSFFKNEESVYQKVQKAFQENKPLEAFALYDEACKKNPTEGCVELGLEYKHAFHITKPDYDKARYYFSYACNNGYSRGCREIEFLNNDIDWESKQVDKFKRLAQYEKDYLAEFENLKKNYPQPKFKFIQPKNKKEACKIAVPDGEADPTKDSSYKIFWDGECKDGYAFGLGREIEKANMKDAWQLGIYENGMAKGFIVQKNLLDSYLSEGEGNYYGSEYIVRRYVNETNDNISIDYLIGKSGGAFEPDLVVVTSPFGNNTLEYHKRYANFGYLYVDMRDNDLVPTDFNFQLIDDKGERHGWGFEKNKNGPLVKGEYLHGKPQPSELPQEYMQKADAIINEIEEAKNKALDAQRNAQLVKKQYLKKICRDSVKVTFMDNSEYKEICEEKDELQLQAKIDRKLAHIQRERTAMIQKQQQELAQQKQNEQMRQQQSYQEQQLALQRQQLEQQRQIAEEQDNRDSYNRMINTFNNLGNQLNQNAYNTNQYSNSLQNTIDANNQRKQDKKTNYQLQQINNNLNGIRYGY